VEEEFLFAPLLGIPHFDVMKKNVISIASFILMGILFFLLMKFPKTYLMFGFPCHLLVMPSIWGFWVAKREKEIKDLRIRLCIKNSSYIFLFYLTLYSISILASSNKEPPNQENEALLVFFMISSILIVSLFMYAAFFTGTVTYRQYMTPIKSNHNKALERNSKPLRSQNPSV